ncbi:MAG: methyltransferase domain-containing protein [FCB group bacterium]|nr:methyltransferase domain-containing protein [FCB group bacterium]
MNRTQPPEGTNHSDHYDRMAGMYDLFLEPLVRRIRTDIQSWIQSQEPQAVLDVCCGTGKQMSYFPEDFPVWGVDLSSAMLSQARRQTHGQCVRGDATRLPFPNQKFDIVLSQFALHEKDRTTLKAELVDIARVLRPGGRLAVLDFAEPKGHTLLNRFFRWGIRQIEKHAGEEHFINYQDWMSRGGLAQVLPDLGWTPETERRYYRENLAWIVFRSTP